MNITFTILSWNWGQFFFREIFETIFSTIPSSIICCQNSNPFLAFSVDNDTISNIAEQVSGWFGGRKGFDSSWQVALLEIQDIKWNQESNNNLLMRKWAEMVHRPRGHKDPKGPRDPEAQVSSLAKGSKGTWVTQGAQEV